MRNVMRVVIVLMTTLVASFAHSHEMTMAEMQLRETRPGEFLWQWGASGSRPVNDELTPVWPKTCHSEENVLRCGEAGLSGELSVDGVGERYSAALVKVFWRDGQSSVYTLTERRPTVHLYGSANDQRGMGEIAWAYLALGVEHILSGIDHLLFVAALLFLVGFNRKLVWTITAFTLAHSFTLASAALGWLTLRSAPVEATIALSIVLVASEALQPRETLARRLPAMVAFLFGLVHGLGFAGALSEIGLPQNHLAIGLLTFNLGVEIGQLMAVAVVWVVWRIVRNWRLADLSRVPLLYGIGALAAFWTLQRVSTIFS
ncbi:MAG TPA: HupE/UreJ family protein [Steroidobacteraceae bacterium]|nr:HupE/UreJ family protein [Steroidobacteraceae bacterium]